jgi:hypothetical protein
MKKILLAIQVFLLCAINTFSQPQPEHYIGLAAGNVVGPSYALHHNRWMAVADAGWLTGFRGFYASGGGMYKTQWVKSISERWSTSAGEKKNHGELNIGVGLFAQDYYRPTVYQQKLAEKLGYIAPFGAVMLIDFSSRYAALPGWNLAVRFRLPVPFTTKLSDDYPLANMLLPAIQVVLQRKL